VPPPALVLGRVGRVVLLAPRLFPLALHGSQRRAAGGARQVAERGGVVEDGQLHPGTRSGDVAEHLDGAARGAEQGDPLDLVAAAAVLDDGADVLDRVIERVQAAPRRIGDRCTGQRRVAIRAAEVAVVEGDRAVAAPGQLLEERVARHGQVVGRLQRSGDAVHQHDHLAAGVRRRDGAHSQPPAVAGRDSMVGAIEPHATSWRRRSASRVPIRIITESVR
jgi:hypothetical protein